MPLDIRKKLDLFESDPAFLSIRGTPDPADDVLHVRLASEYKKYKEMLRDGRIRSRLSRRKQSLLGRDVISLGLDPLLKLAKLHKPLTPEERDGDFKPADKLLAALKYEQLCSALFMSGSLCGFSVVQLDWDRIIGKAIAPSFRFIPQQRFIFAYPELDNPNIPTATGEKLDPRADIIMVQGYELRLLTRENPFWGERCPKNRFIVYLFDGDESPFGLGLGYSLYSSYILKKEAKRAHLLHSDRGGNPPVHGKVPANLNEKDPTVAATLSKFDLFLKGISPGAWGRFPEGYELAVADAIAKVDPNVHMMLIDMANKEISETILGEELFSEKASSSYAANASQTSTIEESLIDGDCSILDEQLQQQFWNAIAQINGLDMVPLVRRATRADLRQSEVERSQLEIAKAKADRDAVLMGQLGLVPSDEYIKETYGEEWSLPADPLMDGEGGAIAPGAEGSAAGLPPIDQVMAELGGGQPATPQDQTAPEFEEFYDFAAKKKGAGGVKTKAKCTKGYSCGYSCIARNRKCSSPLEGQASNYADWLAMKASGGRAGGSKSGTVQADAIAPTAAKPKATTGKKDEAIAPQSRTGGGSGGGGGAEPKDSPTTPRAQEMPDAAPVAKTKGLKEPQSFNPDAKPDLAPREFQDYLANQSFLAGQNDRNADHNLSPAQFQEKYGKSLGGKAQHKAAIQSAISQGYVPSDAALEGTKLTKAQQNQIEMNRQQIGDRQKQSEGIQRAIDRPLLSDEERRGYKPSMTEAEANKYVAGSFTGEATFYHGNRASITDDMTSNGIQPDRNDKGIFGKGAYFAASKEIAEYYAHTTGKSTGEPVGLIAVKARVKNPYVSDQAEMNKLGSHFADGEQANGINSTHVQQFLKAKGHDSIYLRDLGYFVTFDQRQTVVVRSERLEGDRLKKINDREDAFIRNSPTWEKEKERTARSETYKAFADVKNSDRNKYETYQQREQDDF